VTLFSGQFLSAALMLWFFRYWERRYRRDLDLERKGLLDASISLPEEARLLTADGLERIVPTRKSAQGSSYGPIPTVSLLILAVISSGCAGALSRRGPRRIVMWRWPRAICS
jgi:hypothetical protein